MKVLRDTAWWVRHLRARDRRQRADAVAALCAAYEPLVKAMAKRYRQSLPDMGREELEQVARLALVEACQTFDTKRWKRRRDGLERLFARHVLWSVRQAYALHVRGLANPVRLPGVVADKLWQIRRKTAKLAQELMREPTIEELTKAIGMPNGKYKRNSVAMVAALIAFEDGPCSLDSEPANETFAATTLTPEEVLLAKEEYTALRRQRRMG